MAGKKLLFALLLPLPFAALPLAALLFSPGHSLPRIEVTNVGALLGPTGSHRTVSFAPGVSDPSIQGCSSQSNTPVEG